MNKIRYHCHCESLVTLVDGSVVPCGLIKPFQHIKYTKCIVMTTDIQHFDLKVNIYH